LINVICVALILGYVNTTILFNKFFQGFKK